MSNKQNNKDSIKKPKDGSNSSSSSENDISQTRSRQYLTRYVIRPSTAVSYTPRSVRFRPVTTARSKSRDPRRLSAMVIDTKPKSISERMENEEFIELDTHSKKLASLAKSITTSDKKRSHGESVVRFEKRRYSSILSNYPRISDLELILREDPKKEERRRIFKAPRTTWMQKLEETAHKNEQVAKRRLLIEDDEIGDICCCPMFTTHLFFSRNYQKQNYFKLRPEKRAKKRSV